MAVLPRFANGATGGTTARRRVLVGSRRQPPLVEYIAPAAAVSRGAGSSTDPGLGVDPGPSSTVAVIVTIRNDMSVDERSLAYAYGGVFVVNARLLVPDLLTGRGLPETLDGLFVNHAHTVGEFSAEAFVLLLYRGRNLRGFLRVVTDRADLLPIEIFRGCVQEASFRRGLPRRTSSLRTTFGPASACAEDPKDSEHPLRGHFQELRSCKSLDLNMSTRRPSTCSVCCGHRTDAGPRTMKAMRDLQSARKLLANVLRCDAVQFYTRLENVAQDSQTPIWSRGPQS